MSRWPVLITALALASGALALPPGSAALIDATLQPSHIAIGESAELTITASGSTMEPVALPEVSGLEFRVIGQSHRIEIVHGATLVTTSLMVRVTPRSAGTFTIPAMTPKSQPLVLRVDPDTGTGRSTRFGSLTGTAPGGGRGDANHMTPDGSAFVRLILPKKEIYVGESIPVAIEVGMRDGFVKSLNGLPTLTGQDFTLNNLSHQPERIQKLIDGKAFTLLTWHSVLAAVKPGKYSLSVESPLTVRVRTGPQRESQLEDSLGDPFLQNYFGATVSKDVTAASAPAELTVLALPADGRPANFSGAVGSFTLGSELSAGTAAAGDPLTLRLRVTGTGNFDRVDSPMLEHVESWKTYPPRSTFKPADALGYRGEKTFEQPVIATQAGSQSLPGVTFSYFDPGTRRYVTAQSPALAVQISPSLADSSLQVPGVVAASLQGAAAAAASALGLRPDHALADSGQATLIPLYLRPGFLALSSGLSLAFAGGWWRLRGRSAARGPGGMRRAPKAIARTLEEIEAAARIGNAALFFTQARRALLAAVGTELDAESEDIRRLFALADEANYSGDPLTAPEFERWTDIVRHRLLTGPAP